MSGTERPINVCFVGNPNCGKTTLFNAFTGAKLKVAKACVHISKRLRASVSQSFFLFYSSHIPSSVKSFHGITPQTIKKAVRDLIAISKAASTSEEEFKKDPESMDARELEKLAKELTKKMRQAAAELNFEEAAKLRDRMKEVKQMLLELEDH